MLVPWFLRICLQFGCKNTKISSKWEHNKCIYSVQCGNLSNKWAKSIGNAWYVFWGDVWIKHFRPKEKTSYYGIKNYFQALKIVLEGELECFMRGIKSFYPSPLTNAPPPLEGFNWARLKNNYQFWIMNYSSLPSGRTGGGHQFFPCVHEATLWPMNCLKAALNVL